MDELEKQFEQFRPWITQFTIGGKHYGGSLSFENDPRISLFFDIFPDVKTILDLGSLEGGQTVELAKRAGTRVTGIEGRDYNVQKANFIRELSGIGTVDFIYADLETARLSGFGVFDAVFCSGLLYHLKRPWQLIHEISTVTSRVFFWTHYATDEKARERIEGYPGHWYQESGYYDPLSGLSSQSFWVTRNALTAMLQANGFSNVRVLQDTPDHVNGPAIILGAWK